MSPDLTSIAFESDADGIRELVSAVKAYSIGSSPVRQAALGECKYALCTVHCCQRVLRVLSFFATLLPPRHCPGSYAARAGSHHFVVLWRWCQVTS